MSTVPFAKKAVKKHLDGCIRFWRDERDADIPAGDSKAESLRDMAPYYIDAYQSVRISLFGKTLKK